MRRVVLFVLLGVLALVPAADTATGPIKEINVWASQWKTDRNSAGVGFALRAVALKYGYEAFRKAGAERCDQPSTYYTGAYYDQDSGKGGRFVGCTDGGAWHLKARYVGDPTKDPGAAGTVDLDFVPPNRFKGTFTPDGSSKSYPYHGTRGIHFDGDNCCRSLVVNFDVRASGKPNVEIKSKAIEALASGKIRTRSTENKTPHATFTKYNAKVPEILEATETGGEVIVDLKTASGKTRHYEFGVVSRTGYSTVERRLGLLLKTKVSNDKACPAEKSGAILFALPTHSGVRDVVILVGVPFSQEVEINAFLITLKETTSPCKGLAYAWENGDPGVHVSTRLSETVPGATS